MIVAISPLKKILFFGIIFQLTALYFPMNNSALSLRIGVGRRLTCRWWFIRAPFRILFLFLTSMFTRHRRWSTTPSHPSYPTQPPGFHAKSPREDWVSVTGLRLGLIRTNRWMARRTAGRIPGPKITCRPSSFGGDVVPPPIHWWPPTSSRARSRWSGSIDEWHPDLWYIYQAWRA